MNTDHNELLLRRVPPNNLDAEQAVLAGIFQYPDYMDDLVELITPDTFYSSPHNTIFQAMLEMYQEKKPIDLVTVKDKLIDQQKIDEVGGPVYLFELADHPGNSANTLTHANIIRDKAILRGIIQTGTLMAAGAFEAHSASDALAEAERAVMAIASSALQSKAESAESLLNKFFEDLTAKFETKAALSGISSGYSELDHILSGLNKTDLIILAARPGCGKTSFALNVLLKAALLGTPTGFFSLEMGTDQIMQRVLSVLGGVNLRNIRTGFLDDSDWQGLYQAGDLISGSDCPLFIDDTPALSPLELGARARRMKKDHDIGLIVIDYLQLMKVKEKRVFSPEQEIAEISGALKALAKELDIPVIALSQLNRKVEERDDKRPKLSDLRYSGAIEQDADVIMFIYRDELYNKADDNPKKNIAEIIVAKHRNGPCGMVELFFKKECTKFENLHADQVPSEFLGQADS